MPTPGTLAVVGGDSIVLAELRNQLTNAGYPPAGIAEARYVVYLAEPDPTDADVTDIDCAARLCSEVVDLVRQLAERDEHHPVTLWIITRGVREAVSERGAARRAVYGDLRAVIGAEHPDLWGGLIDFPVVPDTPDIPADTTSAIA